MESITNRIRSFIKNEILLTHEEISSEVHLIESGMIDSISLMKLLTYIEGDFSVQFSEDDFNIENFSTIDKICRIVKEKQEKSA